MTNDRAVLKNWVNAGLISVDEARVAVGKLPWDLPQTDALIQCGMGLATVNSIRALIGLPPATSQIKLGLARAIEWDVLPDGWTSVISSEYE